MLVEHEAFVCCNAFPVFDPKLLCSIAFWLCDAQGVIRAFIESEKITNTCPIKGDEQTATDPYPLQIV